MNKDDKYFLRDNIYLEKLNKRNISYYEVKSKKYYRFSSIISVFYFLSVLASIFIIYDKNQNNPAYLTNTLGETVVYVQSEERKKTIIKTLQNNNNEK